MTTRVRCTNDHRLRELVWSAQDTSTVAHLSIPRSTLDDWLRTAPTSVVTLDAFDHVAIELRAVVLKPRRRVTKLLALLRLQTALIKSVEINVEGQRLPEGMDKARILRAVDHSRKLMPIRVALQATGLSASRFNAWRYSRASCKFERRMRHEVTIEESSSPSLSWEGRSSSA